MDEFEFGKGDNRLIITATVVKKNKRLWVVPIDGYNFPNSPLPYTPPDFIYRKLHSRQPLIELAESMIYADEVFERIFEFEAKFNER